ncbi:MAG TPA: hypothetical protein VI837_09725 [Blastocatellia bacterium]|nr:hypothetical protein [Blastocatellia bacterium]
MSKERFERLRESVIEAGQVLRGERKPSREFTYQIEVSQRGKGAQLEWAICVTSDEDALIPLKLYRIKYSKTGYVSVVDEEGEKLVCPASWFVPARLAPEVRQQVAALAS